MKAMFGGGVDGGEYDYLILGAGSAGCVLANRLSASGADSVLLLEAGPMDYKPLIHIPAGVYSVYKDPGINWNYQSEPEPRCDNRAIELPRGKVIGGSSSINAMVYMRGHPLDYDRWAAEFGLPLWRYEHCLPYFKKCESSDRGENDWRGGSGPLGVTRSALQNPLFDALMEAGLQSGQGNSDDLNGYKPEGIARLDGTIRHGRRCSAATAYLKPALGRANLSLGVNALVEKILCRNHRAVGVRVRHGLRGQSKTVRARKSVIVCCGAIKSPQLLMLSGIGPADALRAHGIAPVLDLKGVGQNLQDHLFIHTAFRCTRPVTLDYLTRPAHKLKVGAQWLLTRKGAAASNIWEMGGLVYGNDRAAHPNLQYHFAPVYGRWHGRRIELLRGFQLNADQLRPKSRGTVALRSGDPAERPVVRFNYLSDPGDVRELMEAHGKMQELMMQPAFDNLRGARIVPGPEVRTEKEIESFIRATASTDYHPCGTCRMGADGDEYAVTDGELRVRGMDGLRVVDASVMPDIVSGNLNAPVQMIAERAADFILGRKPLPPLRADFHFLKNNR